MPQRHRLRRLALILPTFVVGAAIVSACSSSSTSSGTSPTSKAPEQIIVSNAKVTAGLGAMKVLFAQAAAAPGTHSRASDLPAKLENQWKQIEGTVKKNDPDAYLRVEEALAAIDAAVKDNAGGSTAARNFSAAADGYLAKFP
jgi:hypothetical protein